MAGALLGGSFFGGATFGGAPFFAADTDADTTPTVVPNGWETARLVTRFKRIMGRGNGVLMQSDELWSDDDIRDCLADAQESVYAELAPRVPLAFISAPLLLTSSDGGRSYDFPAFPFGHVEVFAQESGGLPLTGTTYANNWGDFVFESSKLRMPGNRVRTFESGPYARFTSFPARIAADVEPSLQPPEARELILYKAITLACLVWGAAIDPKPYQTMFDAALRRWLTVWQTQNASNGSSALTSGRWWLGLDTLNGIGHA